MSPPSWADALLRLALPRADQDSISGDLLEEYRQEIVRTKGHAAADLWYVVQVFGYVWRATRLGALVFSGAFLTRTVWDWLVPTADFTTRSAVTTSVARSEEHTSELQSQSNLVCRLLLEKKKKQQHKSGSVPSRDQQIPNRRVRRHTGSRLSTAT